MREKKSTIPIQIAPGVKVPVGGQGDGRRGVAVNILLMMSHRKKVQI